MAFTIAIDGPAAAGKGTIGRALAAHFGFAHLDTGLLYRATGRRTLDGVEPVEAARTLRPGDLDADDLRTPDVSQAASRVAAIPEVRQALLDFQRAFARRAGGAVLDGRDIGTVICPDADVKLFVTASLDARTDRRFAELKGHGRDVTREEVRDQIARRDERDMGRKDAPLKPAPDAYILETTALDKDASIAAAIEVVETKRKG